MGLIKAALSAAGSVLTEQWKDYFYCDAIPSDVMVVKGRKRNTGRSGSFRADDDIVSNGSVIAVNEGQCMIIVEQGKIVDICAEPGEYTYDTSTEPSVFAGDLGEAIKTTFKNIGKRFTFGGETPKDQRVYYFNTKEIVGMKYGTPSPIPFRVVDDHAGIRMDISVSCHGSYTFKIVDPLLFYTEVCGNVADSYVLKGSELEMQMRGEFLTALQPAFGRLSEMGLLYSALPGHTKELTEAMKEELSAEWRAHRGIEVGKVSIFSVKASDEDEKTLKEMQRNAAFMDPARAAAFTVAARGDAMKAAASNAAGAMTGFMGMNMAGGNADVQGLYSMAQQKAAADSWTCFCGASASGNFCPQCGAKKPAPKAADGWTCPACGAAVTGKFCSECGAPRPVAEGWTCSCGSVNKGKFCPECGARKPAGVQQYKCDKCGWEPEKGVKPPKFCPECGDPFDDGDLV